jgi:hypothetical protein
MALVVETKEQARQSRRIELPGSANQLLVGSLFRDQCEPWETAAKSHKLNTWGLVEYFIRLVLESLTDDNTRPFLMRHRIGLEMERMIVPKGGHQLPVGHQSSPRCRIPERTARFPG